MICFSLGYSRIDIFLMKTQNAHFSAGSMYKVRQHRIFYIMYIFEIPVVLPLSQQTKNKATGNREPTFAAADRNPQAHAEFYTSKQHRAARTPPLTNIFLAHRLINCASQAS